MNNKETDLIKAMAKFTATFFTLLIEGGAIVLLIQLLRKFWFVLN